MKDHATDQGRREIAGIARRARAASRMLATLTGVERDEALLAAAAALGRRRAEILEANERDCNIAARAVETGEMSRALFERLKIDESGVGEMIERICNVAGLPDPIGRQLAVTELDDGLVLYKESCPLGVIGVVFESRPDVVTQIAALALKSGNAVILKGGAEAIRTNEVLVTIWRDALTAFKSVPADSINLLETREDVRQLLTFDGEIDLIVPRGSREFVRYIAENSRIPVLGHGEGICHVYVDGAADLKKATDIIFDSKVQYPAACNAAETLLVHERIAGKFLPTVIARLREAGVTVRGCPRTLALLPAAGITPACEADWAKEYSDLIISVKVVESCTEAIAHINAFGSKHTETIVTQDLEAASRFMNEVDAAGVYHNASTRFADGFRYGLGAELGISTAKLHARGPVGLEGLTTYKYKLVGDGHTVASYTKGERSFKHLRLK